MKSPCLPTSSTSESGCTTTRATAARRTCTTPLAFTPSTVAVIIAISTDTPLTTPPAETVATAVFDDDHVTARPVSTFPPAS